MEDWVAVEVRTDKGGSAYFITWGRIQDAVDPAPLEALALHAAQRFSIGGRPLGARVCSSLQEAGKERYFFEALLTFSRERIPHGPDYEAWRRSKHAAMTEGREFYYLGRRAR